MARWFPRASAVTLIAVLAGLCGGCVLQDGHERATLLAARHGFSPLRLEAGDFVLSAWLRPGRGKVLHVYLEGDGFAWRTRAEPSADPTPRMPRGLALAASDPTSGPVLYLGRPCQYVQGADRRNCAPVVWTSGRYGDNVLRSVNEAVDQGQALTETAGLCLYGYSGGGTLAALLAERRRDVYFWGTIAGNLDVEGWASLHQVSPLTGSLNPASDKGKAAFLPQAHVVGSKDGVVPPLFARAWCEDQPPALCRVVEMPGMGHGDAWERIWPDILSRVRPSLYGAQESDTAAR